MTSIPTFAGWHKSWPLDCPRDHLSQTHFSGCLPHSLQCTLDSGKKGDLSKRANQIRSFTCLKWNWNYFSGSLLAAESSQTLQHGTQALHSLISACLCFYPSPSFPTSRSSLHSHSCLTGGMSILCQNAHAVPSAFRAPSSLSLLAKLHLTTHLPEVSVSRGVILILSSVCPLLSTSALISIYLSLSVILLTSLSSVHGLAWAAWTSSWNFFLVGHLFICVYWNRVVLQCC